MPTPLTDTFLTPFRRAMQINADTPLQSGKERQNEVTQAGVTWPSIIFILSIGTWLIYLLPYALGQGSDGGPGLFAFMLLVWGGLTLMNGFLFCFGLACLFEARRLTGKLIAGLAAIHSGAFLWISYWYVYLGK